MTSSTSAGTSSSDSGSKDAAFFLLGFGSDSRTFAIGDKEECVLVAAVAMRDGVAEAAVALEVCRDRVAPTEATRVEDRAMIIPIVDVGSVRRLVATTAWRCAKAFVGFEMEARATSRSADVGLEEISSLVNMLANCDFATLAIESPLRLCTGWSSGSCRVG